MRIIFRFHNGQRVIADDLNPDTFPVDKLATDLHRRRIWSKYHVTVGCDQIEFDAGDLACFEIHP
jgi:hypothetical protein